MLIVKSFCLRMLTEQVSEEEIKKVKCLRFYRPKFSYIFCDMDGKNFNLLLKFVSSTLVLFYIHLFFPCLGIRHTFEQQKSDYQNNS
jgi:hypothetical protein